MIGALEMHQIKHGGLLMGRVDVEMEHELSYEVQKATQIIKDYCDSINDCDYCPYFRGCYEDGFDCVLTELPPSEWIFVDE